MHHLTIMSVLEYHLSDTKNEIFIKSKNMKQFNKLQSRNSSKFITVFAAIVSYPTYARAYDLTEKISVLSIKIPEYLIIPNYSQYHYVFGATIDYAQKRHEKNAFYCRLLTLSEVD